VSSLTDRIVGFVLELDLEAVPDPALRVARTAILDALACALGAQDARAVRATREFAVQEGSRPAACIWGTRLRVSPSRAALVNGTAAHALDYDDVSWAMNGHPSAPIVPSVLAVAESQPTSGAELLAAYVAGFEVAARLGQAMGLSHYARGWHPTATVGALGAAVAAGKLRGLDEDGLSRALGIVSSQLSGSRMNFGTDTKPLHAGLAAQSAVLAVDLAARGTTARTDALDAEMGPLDLYDGTRPFELHPLGGPFALVDPGLELKPYPSCRFTHRTVDAVLALRTRSPDEHVNRIECAVDPFALKILIHPNPTDGLQAKFSLPYCAAVTWLDGWPTVETFSDERVSRSDVQSLLSRVDVREATGPEEKVSVLFESGRREHERVRHARGSPQRPMSAEEHLHKVRSLSGLVLGTERADTLVRVVERIESMASVCDLIAPMVPEEFP
jgi:2-methylcitrate dehydratase PrpD